MSVSFALLATDERLALLIRPLVATVTLSLLRRHSMLLLQFAAAPAV
ncbi:hypothetical protein [Sphingopyxis sp. L1A2A]|nr:hypothetical protein [Sphingopyxis sp. L1A2A]